MVAQGAKFGIPTTHLDTRFRSRLEARWAEMFTLLGWRWTYEPIDLDGYIPDFVLHLQKPVLVEVKPAASNSELKEWAEYHDGLLGGWSHEVLLVGVAPSLVPTYHGDDTATIGLLAERDEEALGGGGLWWAGAPMRRCETNHRRGEGEGSGRSCGRGPDRSCGVMGFIHEDGRFVDRVCGFYYGGALADPLSISDADTLWRQAGNRVQWRAR